MVSIIVDYNSKIPIYKQIRNEIIHNIAEGNLQNGDELPSLRSLAGTLQINYHTVNKAYGLMLNDNIIKLFKNKRFVISIPDNDDKSMASIREYAERFIDYATVKGLTKKEIIDIVNNIADQNKVKSVKN